MKKERKNYQLPPNDIPEDVHLKARQVMKQLLNTPPMPQKEITRKKIIT